MTLLSPDSPPPASRQPGRLRTLLSDGEEGMGICVEPGRIPAFLLEANQRLQEGRIGEVGKLLDRPRLDSVETFCRQDPTGTDVMYILARLLMETGRTEEAEHWYLRILEHDVHAFVYRDLAHICSLDPRRTSEMTRYYEKALKADPTDATAMASLGRGLMLCGQPEKALVWFEQAHRAAPESPGIHDMSSGTCTTSRESSVPSSFVSTPSGAGVTHRWRRDVLPIGTGPTRIAVCGSDSFLPTFAGALWPALLSRCWMAWIGRPCNCMLMRM